VWINKGEVFDVANRKAAAAEYAPKKQAKGK
jgi:hypothetical protein